MEPNGGQIAMSIKAMNRRHTYSPIYVHFVAEYLRYKQNDIISMIDESETIVEQN